MADDGGSGSQNQEDKKLESVETASLKVYDLRKSKRDFFFGLTMNMLSEALQVTANAPLERIKTLL